LLTAFILLFTINVFAQTDIAILDSLKDRYNEINGQLIELEEQQKQLLSQKKKVVCELVEIKLADGSDIKNMSQALELCPRLFRERPFLQGGTDYQNNVLFYAWEVSRSPEFVYTIFEENTSLSHDLKHPNGYYLCWTSEALNRGVLPNQRSCMKDNNSFSKLHHDWGFGLSDGYYKHIVEDERFLSDWRWNIQKTFEVWNGGARFYGGDNISKAKKLITWIK
jgi:hypothetical protein